MPRMFLVTIIAMTALTGLSSVPARAQHMGTPQEQNACSRDASRFCRKDLGNDGAVQSCLQAHRGNLSKSCRKVFESHGM